MLVLSPAPARADYQTGYMAYQAGNYEMARGQWRISARTENDPRSQYALGLLYFRGLTGPVDYTEAADWFGRAARANHAGAIYYLGLMYFNGWGLRYDQFRATDFLKRALKLDASNSDAAFLIGEQYYHGRGADQNYIEAAHYYKLAAERNMHAAQFMLGGMSERGWGVSQNRSDAYYWLKRAASGPIMLPPGVTPEVKLDPDGALATLITTLRPEERRRAEQKLSDGQ